MSLVSSGAVNSGLRTSADGLLIRLSLFQVLWYVVICIDASLYVTTVVIIKPAIYCLRYYNGVQWWSYVAVAAWQAGYTRDEVEHTYEFRQHDTRSVRNVEAHAQARHRYSVSCAFHIEVYALKSFVYSILIQILSGVPYKLVCGKTASLNHLFCFAERRKLYIMYSCVVVSVHQKTRLLSSSFKACHWSMYLVLSPKQHPPPPP